MSFDENEMVCFDPEKKILFAIDVVVVTFIVILLFLCILRWKMKNKLFTCNETIVSLFFIIDLCSTLVIIILIALVIWWISVRN